MISTILFTVNQHIIPQIRDKYKALAFVLYVQVVLRQFLTAMKKLELPMAKAKLDISISEAIDLLAELGIGTPIEFEDYLKGFEVFKSK